MSSIKTDTLVQLIHEYLVHHVHEVRWGIRKTERYDSVLVLSIPGHKRSPVDVLWSNLHLVIALSETNLAEELGLP
jgi:hypothetical protein